MVNLPQDDVKPNQNSKQLVTYEHHNERVQLVMVVVASMGRFG